MARSPFRHSPLDALLVVGAVGQAALCAGAVWLPHSPRAMALCALLFAGTVWWSANTVAHNHLHRPLFHRRWLNLAFASFLTLSTGVPQRLWRKRHLWHHAGERRADRPPRLNAADIGELFVVGALWLLLWWALPRQFLFVYAPGYGLAMLLCQLQGRYEHGGQPVSVEPGISYYGRLYNLLWWNDGYHGEHHRFPGAHWSRLPALRATTQPHESPLPPVLRFAEPLSRRLMRRLTGALNIGLGQALVACEKLALRPGPIQRFMLRTHEQALTALLAEPTLRARFSGDAATSIGIVGGGLYPRTALLLARLLPTAQLVLIDENAQHLQLAKDVLRQAGIADERFVLRPERYCPQRHCKVDLLVFPLGYVGDRSALYQPAIGEPPRLLHDWLWPRRGSTQAAVCVSPWLFKRLCLVLPPPQLSSLPLPLKTASSARIG